MVDLVSLDLKKAALDTLVIPVCADREIHESPLLSGLEKRARDLEEFSGERDEEVVFYDPPGMRTHRVVVAGLGKAAETDAETLRAFAGRATGACIRRKLAGMHLAVPSPRRIRLDPETVVGALLEGSLLANDIFDAYRSEKKKHPLERIRLIAGAATVKKCAGLPGRAAAVCAGTIQAREWVNRPPNDKRPERFVRDVTQRARANGLKARVMGEPTLKRGKFGAILAVAAGSDSKPALAVLDHHPKGARKTVVLVGKGVTFDSGGLNLKPTGSMETMKLDMAGAAAVAATVNVAAALESPLRVVGLLPVVENMVSGGAARPGDIIRTYSGKTVEIGNTDAEGRLILADALAWAVEKFKPDLLVDVATLTGACVVALGDRVAGVFSPEGDLRDAAVAAGEATHERCWPLPMPADYRRQLKSDFADLKNIGAGRWGGAITAALFLSEFVGDTRWMHIDIAGPAYTKKPADYCGAGGTGFGVRLLWQLLENL